MEIYFIKRYFPLRQVNKSYGISNEFDEFVILGIFEQRTNTTNHSIHAYNAISQQTKFTTDHSGLRIR